MIRKSCVFPTKQTLVNLYFHWYVEDDINNLGRKKKEQTKKKYLIDEEKKWYTRLKAYMRHKSTYQPKTMSKTQRLINRYGMNVRMHELRRWTSPLCICTGVDKISFKIYKGQYVHIYSKSRNVCVKRMDNDGSLKFCSKFMRNRSKILKAIDKKEWKKNIRKKYKKKFSDLIKKRSAVRQESWSKKNSVFFVFEQQCK